MLLSPPRPRGGGPGHLCVDGTRVAGGPPAAPARANYYVSAPCGWDQVRVGSGGIPVVPPFRRDQRRWWASGGSCGGLIVFLHLVGVIRGDAGGTPPAWVAMDCHDMPWGLPWAAIAWHGMPWGFFHDIPWGLPCHGTCHSIAVGCHGKCHGTTMTMERAVAGPWPMETRGACRGVRRLSLGRRLVNLLPVAQRTNALTDGVVGRT